jgi:hypothetical protein
VKKGYCWWWLTKKERKEPPKITHKTKCQEEALSSTTCGQFHR